MVRLEEWTWADLHCRSNVGDCGSNTGCFFPSFAFPASVEPCHLVVLCNTCRMNTGWSAGGCLSGLASSSVKVPGCVHNLDVNQKREQVKADVVIGEGGQGEIAEVF